MWRTRTTGPGGWFLSVRNSKSRNLAVPSDADRFCPRTVEADVPEQEEIRRRIRAAMALADIRSWDELAARTPLSRSTLKDLGTVRARADEVHLRVIAAACGVPYAWFTVADLAHAVEREDEDPSTAERLEALEAAVAALFRRDAVSPAPPGRPAGGDSVPAPPGELGHRLRARGPSAGDPGRRGSSLEPGSRPDSGG
jgi:hypothetical protein